MATIAMIYGTRFGQTRKIAEHIANAARARGHRVLPVEVARGPLDFSLSGVDAAVVGAAVYYGRHNKHVARYVAAHRAELERIPSAFFSVSGDAASENAEAEIAARGRLDTFLRETGWHPTSVAMFGGAMANSQYNWLLRRLLVSVARKSGKTIDPSRDYEYTDWVAVDRFAREFLDRLPPGPTIGRTVPVETHAPGP